MMRILQFLRFSGPLGAYRTASVLFLLSGFAALAYEVIWFKRLSLVWGNSTLEIAAVVASYLFGLGTGAQCLGRFADRVKRPLFWYGILEILIGILAICIPWETHWLLRLSAAIYPSLQHHEFLLLLCRLGLTVCIIGPPCFLMGGTLPLLIKEFVSEQGGIPTAWFYAINTLGAAAGCYITGFHLLPAFGLAWTNSIAVLLSIAVGMVASILALKQAPNSIRTLVHESNSSIDSANSAEDFPLWLLCLVSLLLGCGALMLQIVWTRQLALILGSSTYAFTAMLFVVLLGIGSGSLCFHRLSSHRLNLPWLFAVLTLMLVIATIIGKRSIPLLTSFVGLTIPLRASDGLNALTCVFVSLCLEFVPAVVMGMLFPLVMQFAKASAVNIGKTVGSIYASNTLGTILGSLGAGMFLIPHVGTIKTTVYALVVYLLTVILIVPLQPVRRNAFGLVCALAIAASIPRIGPTFDPRLTDIGMFMYGYTPDDHLGTVLQFKEGASCNVLVTESRGERHLRVNGKVDASTTRDMSMQLGLAYFPKLILPDARDILIIGFGSGTTAGASLLFPETRVTCCEIEPEVFAAAKHFTNVNHSPQSNSRLSIVFEDGRSFVQGTDKTFDLILSEPSNPWIAGVCALFTKEFYQAAKGKLNAGGIFAQWVQTYSLSAEEYGSIVRTIASVFPHYGIIRISEGDTILLASEGNLGISNTTAEKASRFVDSITPLRDDLLRYFGKTNVSSLFLLHYCLDEMGVRDFLNRLGGTQTITDSNLRLEFDTPRKIFSRTNTQVTSRIQSSAQIDWIKRILGQPSQPEPDALHELAHLYYSHGATNLARESVSIGVSYFPGHPKLVTDKLLFSESEGAFLASNAARLVEESLEDANRAAVVFWQKKWYKAAIETFTAILAVKPDSANTWANLAVNHVELGDHEGAKAAFLKAKSLDPFNDFVLEAYSNYEVKKRERLDSSVPKLLRVSASTDGNGRPSSTAAIENVMPPIEGRSVPQGTNSSGRRIVRPE
jgi:spermidine synthase